MLTVTTQVLKICE